MSSSVRGYRYIAPPPNHSAAGTLLSHTLPFSRSTTRRRTVLVKSNFFSATTYLLGTGDDNSSSIAYFLLGHAAVQNHPSPDKYALLLVYCSSLPQIGEIGTPLMAADEEVTEGRVNALSTMSCRSL